MDREDFTKYQENLTEIRCSVTIPAEKIHPDMKFTSVSWAETVAIKEGMDVNNTRYILGERCWREAVRLIKDLKKELFK